MAKLRATPDRSATAMHDTARAGRRASQLIFAQQQDTYRQQLKPHQFDKPDKLGRKERPKGSTEKVPKYIRHPVEFLRRWVERHKGTLSKAKRDAELRARKQDARLWE